LFQTINSQNFGPKSQTRIKHKSYKAPVTDEKNNDENPRYRTRGVTRKGRQVLLPRQRAGCRRKMPLNSDGKRQSCTEVLWVLDHY